MPVWYLRWIQEREKSAKKKRKRSKTKYKGCVIMRKYKTLMSFSFRDYGTNLSVFDDKSPVPLFMGCNNSMDKAEGCRVLAAYLLEMAHNYDHAKDFCAPEFDKEQREKQLDELRKTMTPMYEKSF